MIFTCLYNRTEDNGMRNKKVGIAFGIPFILLLGIIASGAV